MSQWCILLKIKLKMCSLTTALFELYTVVYLCSAIGWWLVLQADKKRGSTFIMWLMWSLFFACEDFSLPSCFSYLKARTKSKWSSVKDSMARLGSYSEWLICNYNCDCNFWLCDGALLTYCSRRSVLPED